MNDILNQDKTHHIIIMGDFNAKVGPKAHNQERTTGNIGIGQRNERGDRLIEFTESRNFKIMNTVFKKKPTRKWTRKGPNGETKNEIDFILANNQDIVKDDSVLFRFNTGSDHRLVRAKIKINMRIERAILVRKKTPQVNLQNLQQKADDYQIELQNKCEALYDKVDIDLWCEKITDTITQSAMKVATKETQSKAENLPEGTLKLLKKRRELKH